ncbi:hypothetical protein AAFF_G00313300 [Aldrovandia affinis]|uniref:Uncharacterized protein n=1 Tax=Aldrovandia affinis TaxID=143900 RepID=A0AAD7SNX0_9TELE|nr:hypothetical protein AAFF_G00313300 [Aldrovandia affinis]
MIGAAWGCSPQFQMAGLLHRGALLMLQDAALVTPTLPWDTPLIHQAAIKTRPLQLLPFSPFHPADRGFKGVLCASQIVTGDKPGTATSAFKATLPAPHSTPPE